MSGPAFPAAPSQLTKVFRRPGAGPEALQRPEGQIISAACPDTPEPEAPSSLLASSLRSRAPQ